MSSKPLPSHASVVVIGGGVMGCSTLYHLAKSGVRDAVLLERNQLTSGTTWHSAAQVRALRSSRNLTDLIRYSISLYSSLEAETGQATGWINKGSLSIATHPDRLNHIRRQEALARLFGVEAQSISVGEARERWPLMNTEDVVGAVWSPGDGRVSPSDLCAALVKGARARGAQIFENTGVTGISTKNDRILGIETVTGAVRCEAIALCTGLWSQKNGAMAGVQVPVWPCEHFYMLTKGMDGITGNLPTLSDHDNHLYIRDDSGGLLVGCFEPLGKSTTPERIGEKFAFQLLPEDWEHFEPMMVNALRRVPSLADAEIKMLLNGPESFTPDGSFILGESAETRGLFLGCGMNSVGVATGGGAGMALAHHIINGHAHADLHEVDPKRFPDCFNSAAALTARIPEVLGHHYAIAYPGHHLTTARQLRLSPLHTKWVDADAHFGQFYGWERPLYFARKTAPALTFGRGQWFEQVRKEVIQAHEKSAIFDQSTLGKILVRGTDAELFLNRVCANNMQRAPGTVIYTTLLNPRGGIESDLTALRLDAETYRLYVGTSSIKRDMAWLTGHMDGNERVKIYDETENYAVIAVVGANISSIARDMDANYLNHIPYFNHAPGEIFGVPTQIARLSFVGEAGWEITCAAQDAGRIYEALLQSGARPAGLYAQTSMRIEKRFLAYGHDLDTDINPLQAGLEFTLDWESNFVGREALLRLKEQSPSSIMATIVLEDINSVPLGNEPVYFDGQVIGQTTSAAFGHRIGKPLALAYLDSRPLQDPEGRRVEIDIARDMYAGIVTLKPTYDPLGHRMRTNQSI